MEEFRINAIMGMDVDTLPKIPQTLQHEPKNTATFEGRVYEHLKDLANNATFYKIIAAVAFISVSASIGYLNLTIPATYVWPGPLGITKFLVATGIAGVSMVGLFSLAYASELENWALSHKSI
jgi:hypothetical protein